MVASFGTGAAGIRLTAILICLDMQERLRCSNIGDLIIPTPSRQRSIVLLPPSLCQYSQTHIGITESLSHRL